MTNEVTKPTPVERYQGKAIYRDGDDGFWWDNGGCFETIEECRDDIRAFYAEEEAYHEDTPSLGEPWWSHR